MVSYKEVNKCVCLNTGSMLRYSMFLILLPMIRDPRLTIRVLSFVQVHNVEGKMDPRPDETGSRSFELL